MSSRWMSGVEDEKECVGLHWRDFTDNCKRVCVRAGKDS